MHRFSTAIAIVATLLLAQSCTNTNQTTAANVVNNHQEEHSMKEINHTHDAHSHDRSSHTIKSEFAKAKLTTPENILSNTDIPVTINIQDSKGKTIEKFDRFQEEFMHLILVSDDLQFFSHLHPTYKGNGRFEINARFPQPGNYTFFSDYKPAGSSEQISVLKTKVSGKNISIPEKNLSHTKTFANTKVELILSPPTVKAGEELTVMFHLKNAANNQPVTNLQPYLGEAGHLVILHQAPVLTEANYIHAHALTGTPAGKIHFMTRFPKPGMYKLWGQFKRNGEIVTADFWVNVI
ncbi:hypothetical protein [Aerosakkonema funiforme]|uniref:hypothetical protein n=1 Tax=Aerosakkonema funiforme TaxID=1246630 RepID=UPI0035B7CD45